MFSEIKHLHWSHKVEIALLSTEVSFFLKTIAVNTADSLCEISQFCLIRLVKLTSGNCFCSQCRCLRRMPWHGRTNWTASMPCLMSGLMSNVDGSTWMGSSQAVPTSSTSCQLRPRGSQGSQLKMFIKYKVYWIHFREAWNHCYVSNSFLVL